MAIEEDALSAAIRAEVEEMTALALAEPHPLSANGQRILMLAQSIVDKMKTRAAARVDASPELRAFEAAVIQLYQDPLDLARRRGWLNPLN